MTARPAIVRLAAIQAVLVVALGAGLWLAYPAWRLGQTSDRLRREFPEVPPMGTADLAAWLAAPDTVKPILLDVRTPGEFAVSHLIEAHRVDPLGELRRDDLPDDRGRAIVVMCSTGERSAPFARRLLRAGYQRVFALDGGIIRWANEGRPLTNGSELVTHVHADPEAERLLKRAHRAPAPATE